SETAWSTRAWLRWQPTCSPAPAEARRRETRFSAGWRQMSQSGELDQAYVLARKVLLDALGALRDQRPALTLVGAQAIYLHTGEADFAVPPYTTDGDIALDPRALVDDPKLEDAMRKANFFPHPTDVEIWLTGKGAGPEVDLLVPEAIGGAGRPG